MLIDDKITEISKKKNQNIIEFAFKSIDNVRDLSSYTKLKVGEKTMLVLRDVDLASGEAHNAFLKTLEEAQISLSFILTAKNLYDIPETIISRCNVIKLKYNYELDKEDSKQVDDFINAGLSEQILFIKSLKDRAQAKMFLVNFIYFQHRNLIASPDEKYISKSISLAQKSINALDANANVKLVLTNFLINHK